MMHRKSFPLFAFALGVCLHAGLMERNVYADDVDDQLKILAAVGPDGEGSAAARRARDRLLKRGPEILPRLLQAMDTPNLIAANWCRSVFEQIVSRQLKSPQPKLPLVLFRRFVEDPRRQGRLRRRLLDLLDGLDKGYRGRLLRRFLADPEFREEAVADLLRLADTARKQGRKADAIRQYRSAFDHARSSTQIRQASERLKSLGEKADIIAQMGFVTDWYLLGPFDAPGKTGFTLRFPPEKNVELSAVYQGKNSRKIRWQRHRTTDRLGQVNLISAVASVKEAVGYAYCELLSARDQTAELRCGADDNLTVWLNGRKVFSRLQWLNGTRLDRFSAAVKIKKGRNRLLVKICQGPQHKNPAVPNNWSLQLRFCGKDGKGLGLKTLVPSAQKLKGSP